MNGFWYRTKLWLANLTGFLMANPIIAIILAVVLIFGVIMSVWWLSGSSDGIDRQKVEEEQREVEKRENERLSNSIQRGNEVIANVSNASKQAEANTKDAVNRDFTNTNLTDAEKARCLAYPMSKGCIPHR